jgi:hypothetical protein
MLRLLPRAFALAAVAALVSACSSLDASKPGSWIDTIAGGGSEANGETKTAPPPPSAGDKPPVTSTTTTQTAASTAGTTSSSSDQPKPSSLPSEHAAGQPVDYPNLAAQPELQTSGTTESQRREIRDSLISDRDQAQHSADVLRGGTEKAAAPPPPAPAATAKPADAKPADAKPADTSATDAKPADGSASTPAPTN